MTAAAAVTHPVRHGRLARLAAAARTEAGVFRLAAGVVALHVADDNFLQPNPGMSPADHPAGLIPLGLLVAAIWLYPRLRAGARATIALLSGYLGLLGGIEAIHYTREVGPSGDDYTGLLSVPAGLVLIGLGAATLWRSRKGGRVWWRYTRRLLIAAAALVVTGFVLFTPDGHEDRIGGFMNMAFTADDVQQTFDELSARGVEFVQPPKTEHWGTSAIFKDPDGNTFVLSSR